MNKNAPEGPRFELLDNARARIVGPLDFATVSALLPLGAAAIKQGQVAVIDLVGVTATDSAGLALLIEWLSVAVTAHQKLHYENIPMQIHDLARLSEVDALLAAA